MSQKRKKEREIRKKNSCWKIKIYEENKINYDKRFTGNFKGKILIVNWNYFVYRICLMYFVSYLSFQ